jgi:hypothetical protein
MLGDSLRSRPGTASLRAHPPTAEELASEARRRAAREVAEATRRAATEARAKAAAAAAAAGAGGAAAPQPPAAPQPRWGIVVPAKPRPPPPERSPLPRRRVKPPPPPPPPRVRTTPLPFRRFEPTEDAICRAEEAARALLRTASSAKRGARLTGAPHGAAGAPPSAPARLSSPSAAAAADAELFFEGAPPPPPLSGEEAAAAARRIGTWLSQLRLPAWQYEQHLHAQARAGSDAAAAHDGIADVACVVGGMAGGMLLLQLVSRLEGRDLPGVAWGGVGAFAAPSRRAARAHAVRTALAALRANPGVPRRHLFDEASLLEPDSPARTLALLADVRAAPPYRWAQRGVPEFD